MPGRWCKSVPRRCDLGLFGPLWAICFWPVCSAGQESPPSVPTVRQEPAWQTVEAADAASCHIEGKNSIQVYPRSVGRQSVFLFEGSPLTVSTRARAVYLRLPTVFASPGPRYSDFADARLRIRIDERPWQEIALATARQEWPIAEDLPPGEHHVVIEPVGTMAAVDGFRFAAEPLSCLLGTIDVRVSDARKIDLGVWNNVGVATFNVSPSRSDRNDSRRIRIVCTPRE